jgi:hypothetical protein
MQMISDLVKWGVTMITQRNQTRFVFLTGPNEVIYHNNKCYQSHEIQHTVTFTRKKYVKDTSSSFVN